MERLKVLFITVWYPTIQQPLEGIFVRDYVKTAQLSDDVMVLHCVGPDPNIRGFFRLEKETDLNLTEGIPIYRLWYKPVPIPKIWYFVYLWSILQAFRQIVSHGFYPKIIHAHIYEAGVPAVLIGKLFRIPVVVTEHTSAFLKKRIQGLGALTARFAFESADMVMPVSKSLQKAIEGYGPKARFQIVPNVVDIDLFKPGTSPRSQSRFKRLLCVALLNPSHIKGMPYLLKALSQLQEHRDDWLLDIVGDGPARPEYESMVQNLGLVDRVTFHGLKTREEVAELMRQASIFVLPSLFETFSLVAAEALATGLPVLATRCGGPEDFITNDVGLLVPPGNAEAIRDGLNHMLNDLNRFNPDQISDYATKLFSPENIGENIHNIYKKLTRSGLEFFEVGLLDNRIGIQNNWCVLDIGSGHNPHRRANILLDKSLHNNVERTGKSAVRDSRPFVIADAQSLPFIGHSFDYVIASHVAEHVSNPSVFCAELQRIASRGYIECPGPLGELLLGEPFHLWIVRKKGRALLFRRKKQNNRFLKRISDIFYAIFYVNQNRTRWTIKPKTTTMIFIFSILSQLISKCWQSKILSTWTYTCFEFDGNFDVKVYN